MGLVYKHSPAKRAGLQEGDRILAFGMLQAGCSLAERFGFQPDYKGDSSDAFLAMCRFESVLGSISPVVKASVGRPIELVVDRSADGNHVRLDATLDPGAVRHT